jgi:diguanylate cyclase (GGDEF)-like protein/PAS domain S-box-containing protein
MREPLPSAAPIAESYSGAGSVIDHASAMRACPAALVITDATRPDNPILFVNPAFTELTGYASAEAVGRNCRFLQGADTNGADIADIGAAVRRGEAIRKEILNYRKDGSPFWNDVSISPIFGADGAISSFVGVQTDVTALRDARTRRVEAESQVLNIVSNMPGYIFRRVLKPDGTLLYNGAPIEQNDWRADFAPFPGEKQAQVIHPDDRDAVRRAILRSVEDLQPTEIEFRVVRADGALRWFRSSARAAREAGGDIVWDGVGIDITREKATENQLAGIVEHMPGYVFQRVLKPDGSMSFPYVSPSLGAIIGETLPPGIDIREYIHPDDAERVRSEVARSARDLSRLVTEYRFLSKTGEEIWIRGYSTPRLEPNGDVFWDGVGIDIRQEKASEYRLSRILDNMPGYVFLRVRKPDGTVSFPYVSPSYGLMIGKPMNGGPEGFDFFSNLHPGDRDAVRRSIEQSAIEMTPLIQEFRLICGNGETKWARSYSTPRKGAGGEVLWDCVAVDISTEKAIETKLAYLARHDPLTGLANRELMTARLAAAIKAARASGGEIAVSMILILDFAEINETLGMDDGDAVLRSAGARLNQIASLESDALVGRLGNSDFAILRSGERVRAEAEPYAETLLRAVAQPILIGNDMVSVEPCAGTAALGPGDLEHLPADAAAAEVLKRAAMAVSAAAKAGPSAHRLYDEELDHRTRHRMVLRHSMRHAIEHDEFELHYQPLVDLRSGRIVSAEALIRWRHPELGLLRPDLFISLAEESGQMGALGDWVMRRAMRQTNEWNSRGLKTPKIALNVSGVQIRMPDYIATVRRTLMDTGADARRFELELTEGILVERSRETLATLGQLKALGFELVIDDFGAGHSNFQYLRSFPVDKLKIDQIFVRQLVADSNDALIIRAIAALAQSLNLDLVAEGIETREQHEFLRDQGCPTGQGYYFSLPLAAEDFGWMIENDVILPMSSARARESAKPAAGARA